MEVLKIETTNFWMLESSNPMMNREKIMNLLSYKENLTCSTPSMCASISWMTLVSLSASSAERRPLLIFSANRLMFLWASSRYAWSGWSSAVCFSRSYKTNASNMWIKCLSTQGFHRPTQGKSADCLPWPAARIEGSSGRVWSSDLPAPVSPCSHACIAVEREGQQRQDRDGNKSKHEKTLWH